MVADLGGRVPPASAPRRRPHRSRGCRARRAWWRARVAERGPCGVWYSVSYDLRGRSSWIDSRVSINNIFLPAWWGGVPLEHDNAVSTHCSLAHSGAGGARVEVRTRRVSIASNCKHAARHERAPGGGGPVSCLCRRSPWDVRGRGRAGLAAASRLPECEQAYLPSSLKLPNARR